MYLLGDFAESDELVYALTPAQRRLRLRPKANTTADRLLAGGLEDGLVFYDWQQHWSSVKPLFARTDVKWASLQLVSGLRKSRYHGDEFRSVYEEAEDGCCPKMICPPHAGDWPPHVEPGVHQSSVFPLLMTSDGWMHGGDGYEKGEFAFAHMPQAERDRLLLLEEERLEHSSMSDDETLSTGDTEFDIAHASFMRCEKWLAEHFDDCRLLYSGLDRWLTGKFM